MNFVEIIHHILDVADSEAIGLPAANEVAPHVRQIAMDVMTVTRSKIGPEATESEYFKSCEERFETLLTMALQHLPEGGRVLDIGNAPGYLAIMLAQAGYLIDGVNLSDAWSSSYPHPSYVDQFRVKVADIEKEALPYSNGIFDCIVFTEVLEHIAVKHPRDFLPEFRRVLRKNGVVIFSTPNVCNVSNIVSLLQGKNIFWDTEIFYGSTDRHNREFTPLEVRKLFEESGFITREWFGMNDHANWRSGSARYIYDYQAKHGVPDHGLMRNTIIGVFGKTGD